MTRYMTAMMRRAAAIVLGVMMTMTVSAQVEMGNDAEPLSVQHSEVFTLSFDNTQNGTNLLNGYVQQRFDKLLPGYTQSLSQRRSAKDGLSGDNLLAYNYLKEIIQQIAAGQMNTTAFQIPIDNIMTKTTWTAEELGVGNTFPDNVPPKDLVRATFQSCIDFSMVIGALLCDLPFEFYWFDKTEGWKWGYGYQYNNKAFYFTEFSLKMNIAEEYAVQSGDQYYPTQFNTSKVAAVNMAVENAQYIVDNSTGTLLERLTGYKNKICQLTSYNTAAANNNWAYGNPWQLVWVFDGDTSTKVVCEGYAKAFKYLCDLSNFNNAECLTVSGTMGGGTGEGPHMWNVMKMDDDRNYLVDVTNCDNGTTGYPDKLFMASGPGGSYSNGYSFSVERNDINYTYDDETKALYSQSALTISPTAYKPIGTGISNVSSDGNTPAAEGFYTLDGKRVEHPQKGIYIARMNDQTKRKVVVK